jgi:hypothetical protein
VALHRINLNLPVDLHSRFAATARREDRTLTVVLARALEAYIAGSEGAADQRQGNRAVDDLDVPGSFSTSSGGA